jgi:DNA-binding transcriptional ArsR family regulator
MARSSTTSDVFNAIAEAHRREVLDALIAGEKAVGEIVNDLSMSQPQVSKHLRVLSEVGLVRCRAEGRRRLYRRWLRSELRQRGTSPEVAARSKGKGL